MPGPGRALIGAWGPAGVGSVLFLLAQVFSAQRVFSSQLLSGNK